MTTRLWLSAVSVAVLAWGVAGCGSGVGTGEKSVAADSQACIDCHDKKISVVTGANIVSEWRSSRHGYMNAAGCNDCHEANSSHAAGGNTCSSCHGGGGSYPKAADANGKCFKCHGPNFPDDIMVANAPQHLGVQDAAVLATYTDRLTNSGPASYLSTQYIGKCRACHNPHDPTTNMAYNKAWAAGGMGNVNSGARGAAPRTYDFKLLGTEVPANRAFIHEFPTANSNGTTTPGCVRCHTTTGFINFVNSGFLDLRPFGGTIGGAYTDKTKEVTGCDACHADYNFKNLRKIGASKMYFNFRDSARHAVEVTNVPTVFPDFGKSNLCVPCHAGRGIGKVIHFLDSASVDFSNAASPSGHVFGAAGTLAGRSAYEFPGREYETSDASYKPLGTTYQPNPHENIGLVGANPKGPCVACHMDTTVPADSHKFMSVRHVETSEVTNDASASTIQSNAAVWTSVALTNSLMRLPVAGVVSNTCSTFGCHSGTGTSAITTASMNEDKLGYMAALGVLNNWLTEARNGTGSSSTNWNYFGPGSGRDTMGASFNRGLLSGEPGGYVHRPLYARRVVFDSIAHLSQREYPAKDALAVKNAIRDIDNTNTFSNVSTNRRISPTLTSAARNWLFGRYTSGNGCSAYAIRRPGDATTLSCP